MCKQAGKGKQKEEEVSWLALRGMPTHEIILGINKDTAREGAWRTLLNALDVAESKLLERSSSARPWSGRQKLQSVSYSTLVYRSHPCGYTADSWCGGEGLGKSGRPQFTEGPKAQRAQVAFLQAQSSKAQPGLEGRSPNSNISRLFQGFSK